MTSPRDEPSGWQLLWNAGGRRGEPLARALEARMRREGRRMWWITFAQSLASVAILAWVGQVMVNHPDPFHLAWGSGVAALIAGAWVFLLINRKGVWTPYAETTQAFLAVLTERCRRRLRMVRVVTALAVLHLVFTAWLAWWGSRLRPGAALHPADAATYMGAVVLFIGVIVWAASYRRRIVQELAQLKEIAALLG